MIGQLRESILMLLRRKSRTVPAVLAAAAGIFLLIVTASVSSYFLELSRGLSASFRDRIFLCEKRNFWIGGGLIPEEKLRVLSGVPGIGPLVPILVSRAGADELVVMGVPEMMVGVPVEKAGLYVDPSALLRGRLPSGPDEIVAGWNSAKRRGLSVGSRIELKGGVFRVAGILKKTSSVLDDQLVAPLPTMQSLLEREGLLTCVMALPESMGSVPAIASEVKARTGYVNTVSSEDIERGVGDTLSFWNALTAVFFLISGLGSLMSLSAVTAMSVTERRREIAVKMALGAEKRHVYTEFLLESVIMVALAWIVGMAGSAIFVAFCDSCPFTGSAAVFRLSPEMLALSLVWSLLVAAAAVYVPLRGILSETPAALLRG